MSEKEEETELQFKQRYKATRTIYEMLSDRGYDNQEFGKEEFSAIETIEEFEEYFKDPNNDLVFQNPTTRDVIVVVFTRESRIGNKSISPLLTRAKNHQANHTIIVHPRGAIQSIIRKAHQTIEAKTSIKIEFFDYDELQYNVTKHMYVPRHKPLSNDEKEDLFLRYKISAQQLPIILKTDPVSRYYGAEPGTVMEITRRSETCGRYITYRVVV